MLTSRDSSTLHLHDRAPWGEYTDLISSLHWSKSLKCWFFFLPDATWVWPFKQKYSNLGCSNWTNLNQIRRKKTSFDWCWSLETLIIKNILCLLQLLPCHDLMTVAVFLSHSLTHSLTCAYYNLHWLYTVKQASSRRLCRFLSVWPSWQCKPTLQHVFVCQLF